jgi:peptide deformylase
VIREIVQAGHPALRKQAVPVDPAWIGTPEFVQLVKDMVETMRDAPGVGLAAPQIGLSIQLVVLEDRPETLDDIDDEVLESRGRDVVPLTVLVNPTIKTYGKQDVEFYEGCLSVSGWAAVTPRYKRVKVHALDENAQKVAYDWNGWPARILQHEIDHLNSTLYIDHMDTTTFATTENLVRDFGEDNEG